MPMHEDECSPKMLVMLVDMTSACMVFCRQGHLGSPACYMSTNPPLTISSMNSPTDDSPTDNGSSTDDSQEAHIKSAVEAVHAHMLLFHDAAKQFEIPATTISNHLKGGKAPSVAHESQQLLSNKQQKVVIEWLRWRGNNGNYLITCEHLAALIFDLMEQRPMQIGSISSSGIMLTKSQREGHVGSIHSMCRHSMRPLSHTTSSCSSHSLLGRGYPQRTFTMRMRREFSWEGGGRTSPSNTAFQRKIMTSTLCNQIHSSW